MIMFSPEVVKIIFFLYLPSTETQLFKHYMKREIKFAIISHFNCIYTKKLCKTYEIYIYVYVFSSTSL